MTAAKADRQLQRPKLVGSTRCKHGFHDPLCVVCHSPDPAKEELFGNPSVIGRRAGSFVVVRRVVTEEGELDCAVRCDCGTERTVSRRHFRTAQRDASGGSLRCFGCKPLKGRAAKRAALNTSQSTIPTDMETDTQ